MKLYDYLQENRKYGTLIAYAVPVAYPTVSNEAEYLDAPAGDYAIAYNFEINFNGIKDKPLEFITIVNDVDGQQFAETSPDRDGDNFKSRLYGRTYPHAGGDLKVGIKFQDTENSGFVISHCNVSITRLS